MLKNIAQLILISSFFTACSSENYTPETNMTSGSGRQETTNSSSTSSSSGGNNSSSSSSSSGSSSSSSTSSGSSGTICETKIDCEYCLYSGCYHNDPCLSQEEYEKYNLIRSCIYDERVQEKCDYCVGLHEGDAVSMECRDCAKMIGVNCKLSCD